MITQRQWDFYQDNGYVKVGRVYSENELAALQQRIDAVMLGTAEVAYDQMLMQLDGLKTKQSKGFKGATLDYRKIQGLEYDQLYLDYMRKPIFQDLCRRVYGEVSISAFRAMFMNKPAGKGTVLRWHQDRWSTSDRDPLITAWTALDPATIANGCVQVIPGSHARADQPVGWFRLPHRRAGEEILRGRADRAHGTGRGRDGRAAQLAAALIGRQSHRYSAPRLSVCYMDARTTNLNGTECYPEIFSPAAAA